MIILKTTLIIANPDDIQSIKAAVDKAYNNPVNPKLKQKVLEKYIWEKTAEETLKGYALANS